MSFLWVAMVFLAAAVVAVPIARWLGFGAVLGYLAAGVAIGPWGLGLISAVENVLHFSEIGVVLLLFVIGLELQPTRLLTMRKPVFGLGGAQVLFTGIVFAGIGYGLGLQPVAAMIIGVALSLSSTAFALQIMAERNELTTRHGRTAFSVLLFQDLAVIPLVALIPAIGPGTMGPLDSSGLRAGLEIAAILVAAVLIGHYALRYLLRAVAAAGIREVFTAMALLLVIGAALFMDSLGLSMGLGAFLAGVLLADSEYRHALEADIEPFKGLFLGLFFIAVGMSFNLDLLAGQPLTVGVLVFGLVGIKGVILWGLGHAYGLRGASGRGFAVALSQGGEFAFVILGVAVGANVVDRPLAELLIAVVTLSMVTTPLLVKLNDLVSAVETKPAAEPSYDPPPLHERHVIIAGFGRFGQIVGRILTARKIPFTALESNPRQVDFLRRFGNKVYYGNAARVDLLRAAGADKADAFVLATGDVEGSLRIAETVRRCWPHLTIYARARDRQHAYRLMDLGITVIRRETFLSSVDTARTLLIGLGLSEAESDRVVHAFQVHDELRLWEHFWHHTDDEKMRDLAKEGLKELEELFAADAADDVTEDPQLQSPATGTGGE